MVALDRFKTGDARQDELAAAAVTGKEMGRNAVDDDDLSASTTCLLSFNGVPSLVVPKSRESDPCSRADRS